MFDEYTIKDVIEEVIDYRGKTPKKLGGDWSEEKTEYMALSAKNIKKGRIVQPDTIRYVNQEMYNKWMKQEVERGTILITSEAPFGELLYWDSDDKIVLSQRLFGLKIKKEFNSRYIYYYMFSEHFQSELSGRATGSTVTGLRQPELLKCHLKVPNRKVQDIIADILMNIDKKIDLNNEINNNLYDLLRTNYDDIFNNDDSRKIRLEEIVSIRRGASPRPIQEYLSEKGVNWLKISDVTGIDSPFIYSIKEKIKDAGKSKSVFINKGTLVVSNSATPGIPKYIMVDTCVHDGWLILSEYDEKYRYYLYFLIEKIREKLISLSNGSVFNNLKTDILKGFMIGLPSDEQLESFNYLATPIMHNINSNTKENIELEQLRDTLLPKLMNGEIGLDNIEI